MFNSKNLVSVSRHQNIETSKYHQSNSGSNTFLLQINVYNVMIQVSFMVYNS